MMSRFDQTGRTLWAAVRARPREAGAASVGVLVMSAVGVGWVLRPGATAEWPTATVRTADVVETIVESGTVSAARMRLYSAPSLGAPAKIVELVPEGTVVAPGDVLVRFDVSQIELARDKDEAALRLAEAEFVRATEDVRIEQLRVEGDREAARQEVAFAEQDLANEVDGRGRLELAEAEAAATEAGREVERARRAVADVTPMLAEGFATRAEVERAEQALRRAEEVHRIALLKLESLTRFERPAAVEKSRAGVQAARQGAARLAESSAARLTQRRASAAMAHGRVEEIRVRLRTLVDQLSRTTIRADGAGLVVYRELFFGADRRKPQVGDEVWPNQPLIALPDSSELLVETRVREIDLHRVATSQRVVVRVDAYPDVRLAAGVALVGALATVDDARAGTKYFPVTVRLAEADPRLRNGMTARVEIQVASLPSAITVPRAALFEKDAETVAYVLRRGRPERRTVVVAAENAEVVAIQRGLAPGDTVLLRDPEEAP